MDKIIEKYGEKVRCIKYYPKNKIKTFVLVLHGDVIETDGQKAKSKNTKIYSTTFEGLFQ